MTDFSTLSSADYSLVIRPLQNSREFPTIRFCLSNIFQRNTSFLDISCVSFFIYLLPSLAFASIWINTQHESFLALIISCSTSCQKLKVLYLILSFCGPYPLIILSFRPFYWTSIVKISFASEPQWTKIGYRSLFASV